MDNHFDKGMQMDIYKEAADRIRRNEPAAISTRLRTPEGTVSWDLSRSVTDIIPAADSRGRMRAAVGLQQEDGFLTVTEPVFPEERLIILGGGHVAVPLCAHGAACGFAVTVIDDRPAFADRDRFPDARNVICDNFAHAIDSLSIGPYDYVAIVTRGHLHDADCLRRVILGTPPAYLGMIGSRRRVSAQMELLRREGLDAERLAGVRTPIGLAIGAVTPAEISISILAEIISFRRLPDHAAAGHTICDSDLEVSMIRYLAENTAPKAVATVLEAAGSTPRGAGAKMAVDRTGRITGTIGGGSVEGAVIPEAVKLIGTGRYRVLDFDLSNDVAASEGMVCGGSMKVLVEDACAGTGQS